MPALAPAALAALGAAALAAIFAAWPALGRRCAHGMRVGGRRRCGWQRSGGRSGGAEDAMRGISSGGRVGTLERPRRPARVSPRRQRQVVTLGMLGCLALAFTGMACRRSSPTVASNAAGTSPPASVPAPSRGQPSAPKAARSRTLLEGHDLRDAAALYAKHCARCHLENGAGDQRTAKDAVPDFTTPAWFVDREDNDLVESVTKGKGKMPAFGRTLTFDDISTLVVYVQGLSATEDERDFNRPPARGRAALSPPAHPNTSATAVRGAFSEWARAHPAARGLPADDGLARLARRAAPAGMWNRRRRTL
jgi:mono/diheme cytochrome c family protein